MRDKRRVEASGGYSSAAGRDFHQSFNQVIGNLPTNLSLNSNLYDRMVIDAHRLEEENEFLRSSLDGARKDLRSQRAQVTRPPWGLLLIAAASGAALTLFVTDGPDLQYMGVPCEGFAVAQLGKYSAATDDAVIEHKLQELNKRQKDFEVESPAPFVSKGDFVCTSVRGASGADDNRYIFSGPFKNIEGAQEYCRDMGWQAEITRDCGPLSTASGA